jgi:polyisoprenyl-phosphate glycosyltransferase
MHVDAMVIVPQTLSVLIPVHNEAAGLPLLKDRLVKVLSALDMRFEVLLVDDGSRDNSLALMRAIAAEDSRFKVLGLSRNFGKEIAIAAGLDHVSGHAVVIIDADLQMPPELIPRMVEKWKEGFATVYGERIDRHSDGPFRRWISGQFYKLFGRVADMRLQERAGDFRLMDRKVIEALRQMPERARFTKGLYAWVGYSSTALPYDHVDRAAGASQWGFRKLFSFGLDGLTSFSSLPLRFSTYVGLIISGLAIVYALYFLIRTLFIGPDVPGFPSLIVSIMFFSGIQLISLGVIGEYVGRIFDEVKKRPLYLIDEKIGFDKPDKAANQP